MNTTSNSPSKPMVSTNRPMQSTNRCMVIAACSLIISGYILMVGPGSTEQAFNPEIFSVRRVVVAPALCLAGYLLIALAILCSPTPPPRRQEREETRE